MALRSRRSHERHVVVGKFDEATWQLFNMLGLSPSYLRAAKRGMAAVDQHISYLQELHAGDIVTIRITLLEIKEKSIRFVHEMAHDETPRAAKPQPKSKQTFHHEGREDHEVRN
jgi:acyl-CoA thioesterase FadM